MSQFNWIKQTFANIEKNGQQIKELFFSFPGPVLLLSYDFRILEFNQLASEVFNWRRQGVLGSNFYDLARLYSIDFPAVPTVSEFPENVVFSEHQTTVGSGGEEKTIKWDMLKVPGFCDLDYKFLLLGYEQHDVQDKILAQDDYFPQLILNEIDKAISASSDIDFFKKTLQSVVNSLPGSAHIKSSGDFSYIATNASTLTLIGFKHVQDLLGKTDYDLAEFMGTRWPDNFASELREYDEEVLFRKKSIINQEEKPYLNAKGELVIHSITKIPLLAPDNTEFGLLTFAIDMAHLKDPSRLREIYRGLYKNSTEAHSKFLQHIGFDQSNSNINTQLTERELDCLISLSRGKTLKEVAKELNISPRTVETHLERIKYKFNCQTKTQAIDLFISIYGRKV